ncbi:MAG: hypothetical protein JWL61_1095 [Gemmatimonadetes bacterium]|nr:hypothetical protein [Gemmatimonadota bacterium]
MRRTIVLVLCSGCLTHSGGPSPIAGTYRISVCKSATCTAGDSTQALASGTLVLLDSNLVLATLPRGARAYLEPFFLRGKANGCLAMGRHPANGTTFAGGVRSTSWVVDSNQPNLIRFELYQSPDARYGVTAAVVNGELAGRSQGSAFINGRDYSYRDTVVGRRIGRPYPDICVSASIEQSTRNR